jgi:hypothetical protein
MPRPQGFIAFPNQPMYLSSSVSGMYLLLQCSGQNGIADEGRLYDQDFSHVTKIGEVWAVGTEKEKK